MKVKNLIQILTIQFKKFVRFFEHNIYSKNCKYAFNQLKEKEDNKEINFWFSETDDEIDKLIKEKYFQVKHEIRLVYPKLGEDIDSLCFYNYMEHIKKVIYTKEDIEKNDLNILAVLATFKIECWISADNIAGENRFFC